MNQTNRKKKKKNESEKKKTWAGEEPCSTSRHHAAFYLPLHACLRTPACLATPATTAAQLRCAASLPAAFLYLPTSAPSRARDNIWQGIFRQYVPVNRPGGGGAYLRSTPHAGAAALKHTARANAGRREKKKKKKEEEREERHGGDEGKVYSYIKSVGGKIIACISADSLNPPISISAATSMTRRPWPPSNAAMT